MVALLLTGASTGAFAREFRAADTQNEDYPTVQALHYMGSLIEERTGSRHRIKVFHSSGSIYSSVRPVRSIADLAGLRLRVQQSEQMSEMIPSPGEAAMAGLHARARRDGATAQLIERIRKVE